MPTLYLIEQNTYLRKSGDRLLLCKKSVQGKGRPAHTDEIILDLPCADVSHVMLFGNIQVTTQALQELLEHEIELAIFSYSGRLLGQLTPPCTKNIELRIAQFERYKDEKFKLNLARSIVMAKLHNATEMVRQHRKNHPETISSAEADELAAYIEQSQTAKSFETLRGIEGAGSACYFKLFGSMLIPPWQFNKRSRRPPQDPANAVLSFGYVIVGAEIQAMLDGIGFDPYLGFYHTLKYGRPSLALDLLEAFRHPLIDRLALNLFNRNQLSEADFMKPAKGGIYLATEGKRVFFKEYEKMLGQFVAATDVADRDTGFRADFQQQVRSLQKAILEGKPFQPFSLKSS
ncbi:CRISPR-associated endonuclease Cas1 [candidate division KSB1 bacterium]|nr:CRISPR-associated endonuclease Cas1 [candidate division KSB1 bacterium]